MVASRANDLLRQPEAPRPISYMELFFDLVYIFVLAQLTLRQTQDLSMAGTLRSLLLLAALWWVWTVTAWSTDWFDPEQPAIRRLLLWVMLGSLLLAAASTRAFGEWAIIFAGTYVAIHLGRGAGLIFLLRSKPAAAWRSARVAGWFAITGVAWIAGALVPAAQYPLWGVAVVVDATVGLVGYPLPRLGRSTQAELRISGTHLTQRYRQLAIVAFGELILMSGIGFRRASFHPFSTAAFVLAFVNAALFVQIYHLPVGGGFAAAVERSRSPSRVSLITGYLHFLLLAGVVIAATGNEVIIENATGRGGIRYAGGLAAGCALFLAWRIASLVVVRRRPPWWLWVGLLALVAATPAMAGLPPVGETATVDAVLLAVILLEQLALRRERPGRGGARGPSSTRPTSSAPR